MISMLVVFYMFIIIFALVGAMRGWAKELLVTLSVILSMAFIMVIESYAPVLKNIILGNKETQFWFRAITLVVIVLFGYQSPRISRIGKSTERRDRIQDLILGIILGAVSGYFVMGTLWHFSHQADYFPIAKSIIAPKDSPNGEAILRVINFLPPAYLMKSPINVFIVVVLAFIFVIVVFV